MLIAAVAVDSTFAECPNPELLKDRLSFVINAVESQPLNV